MINVILIMILALICAGLIYMHINEERRKTSEWMHIGCSKYTDGNKFIHQNFRFQDNACLTHNTADYIPVLFSDNEHIEFVKDDILIFTNKDCPKDWRHHYVLIQDSNNNYRICRCTTYDKITHFPPLFDGIETPGIGYTIIGFLQFRIKSDELKHSYKTYF